MKALLLAGAASFMAAPALAGPYVNIESNSAFLGSDYSGTVTETHVGYEADLGEDSAWYIQAGPAFVSPDGEDLSTELSGKVGIGTNLTENVNLYAEVAAMTNDSINLDEDASFGTKIGVKYTF